MKRFIAISIVLLSLCTPSMGCAWIGTTNYYMFSVFRREQMNTSLFADQFKKFWEAYTDGEVSEYAWHEDDIMDIAKKKNDLEMTHYLEHLNKYLEISQQLGEHWEYPTKEQLAQRKTDLGAMIAQANGYNGKRLKAQWELLRMRANMVLGNHTANITQWEQKSSKLPASAYREMMRNIYAGALLHQGRRTEACDIYAEQGDLVSIKWAMRKHRNLAGIKAIFAENPNSPTMNYLVQDFVNNVQETIDSDGDKDWIEGMLDQRVVLLNEANSFISYARKVVEEKKTQSPAMWMAAIGELQYLQGQYRDAMGTLSMAMEMKGTERMRDNARTIRLITSAKANKLDMEYTNWLAEEMKWLMGKIKEEGTVNDVGIYSNHYYEMLVRLVHDNLVPRYEAAGQPEMAAALLLMMESGKIDNSEAIEATEAPNPTYSGEYFAFIDKMSPDGLIAYQRFLKSKAQNPFEALVKNYIEYDETYYNDLIGTAFLACDELERATSYLRLVPLNFIERQGICPYTVRDFTKARWLGKQKIDENGENPKVSSNPKINFCNEVLRLKERFANATGESRKQLAYSLAVRYYQASHLGDCWYLTQYGQSICDTIRTDRANFIAKAVELLEESATSTNHELKLNSLYGLAFIPLDEWCEWDYDWEKNRYVITETHPESQQYSHLWALHQYTSRSKEQLPFYVTKCDVLKKFRENL
ncbi:MAG: hypothetical protein IKI26_07045 [Prevotella sp.]|nr:hypothetical protein [Prevotella sp.]